MSIIEPYIGVTGFMSTEEVSSALKEFEALFNWRRCKLMVGVLASSKTLAGGTNKWPNRYPKVGDIAGLFPQNNRALNLIHYSTDDRGTLKYQLQEMIRLGGDRLHGFQLNIRWPDPESIAFLQGRRVVLQLGRRALDEVGNDPKAAADRLDAYRGIVTDVLVDASGGNGIPIDVDTAMAYVSAISRQPGFGVGVAGGLSASTLDPLWRLVDTWPSLSIDAEGRLRTPEDHLDIRAVKDYLEMADDLFE
jgi:hypothetical protein